MNQQEFLGLQKGDRVKYVPNVVSNGLIEAGEIVVRTPNWLDCQKTQRFIGDKGTVFFFNAEQVEKV